MKNVILLPFMMKMSGFFEFNNIDNCHKVDFWLDPDLLFVLVLCSNQVTPAAGIINPEEFVEVSVSHKDFHTLEEYVDGIPQNWWSEDTRDKEVFLVINVCGSCSTHSYNHRVRVRHCYSGKSIRIDSKSNHSRKYHGGLIHRSDLRQLSTLTDAIDDSQHMKTPQEAKSKTPIKNHPRSQKQNPP